MGSRIIAALSLFLVACSALATFDGLVGSAESSDGGGAGGDASALDGGASGQGGDATANDDGGGQTTDGSTPMTDGGGLKDGGDSGYCSTHPGHTFCDDFDNAAGLATRWTVTTNLGSTALNVSDFTSPPKAVLSTSPDNDGGFSGENDIQKDFTTTKTLTLEASVKINGLGAYSCDFMAVEFTPTDVSAYFGCYVDVAFVNGMGVIMESECYQPDGGNSYQTTLFGGALPSWDRIQLKVDLNMGKLFVKVNGTTKSLPIPSGLSTTKMTAMLGVVFKDPGPGNAVVRVDDVLVDAP